MCYIVYTHCSMCSCDCCYVCGGAGQSLTDDCRIDSWPDFTLAHIIGLTPGKGSVCPWLSGGLSNKCYFEIDPEDRKSVV